MVSNHICPAYVTRIIVFLFVHSNDLLRFFCTRAGFGKGKELAHLLFVESFRALGYGAKGIVHVEILGKIKEIKKLKKIKTIAALTVYFGEDKGDKEVKEDKDNSCIDCLLWGR